MKTTLIILFLLTVFMTNTFAEHLPHLSIEGHWGGATSVVFSPDGQTLASTGWSGAFNQFRDTIRLWDVKTGQNKQVLTGSGYNVTSIAFSPDGQTLASGSGKAIAWDEIYGIIRLWDVNTGRLKAKLEGHRDYVMSIAFSPDGQTLASGSGRRAPWDRTDNTIHLWDANTGEHKHTLRGHTHHVLSVAFSPDGRTLASGSSDATFRLWDANTGKHRATLAVEDITGIPAIERVGSGGVMDGLYRVAFSPDGQTFAANTKSRIYLWDANTGTLKAQLAGPIGDTGTVFFNSIAFSPDGRTLASGTWGGNSKRVGRVHFFDKTDPTILLWDIHTGKPKKVHTLTHDVTSVAFSPDGGTLVYVSGGAIYLWDIVSDQLKYSIFRHRATELAFSPDGQTLASGGDRVILWDPITRHQKRVLNVTGDRIAFSPDGQILATGNWAGPIHLWDPNTGKLQETFTLPTYTNNPRINSIVFSPDGQTLASGGDGITLWNVNKGWEKAWRRFSGRVLSFSPDGQILATTGENKIHLWDANTLQHKYSIDKRSDANSIAFSSDGWMITVGGTVSPDGRTIATRAGPRTIDLWDANTGELKTTLTGTSAFNDHNYNDSTGIAFSPDGRTIVSGGEDNIIRLWKLPDTRVNITPYPVASPAIGEQFTINLSIVDGENVGGYQFTVGFDEAILRYVESANGDYLLPGSFFVPPVVSENAVTLSATSLTGTSSGDGTLASVTFEMLDVKESPIALSDAILTDSAGKQFSILTNSGRIEPTLSSTSAIVDFTPSSVLAPAIGEQLAFNIRIANGQNVAGYQVSLEYDTKTLKPVLASNGVYLPDAYPAKPFVSEGLVTLGASSSTGVGNGDGVLATITFEVLVVQASTVSVSGYLTTPNGLRSTPTFKGTEVIVALRGDVNRDGTVNILDLVLVASSFGQQVPETGNPADVNEDGIINVVDLVTVAGAIGGGAAAPSLHPQALDAFTAVDIQQWLTQAQHVDMNDAVLQRGIRFLEQLLVALIPKETALLVNYPNPFNPETWIPYQLAEPADVTLTIYAIDGTIVRTLALGHQPVGIYQDKSRAAYWDGRNELGESVASGVYFYTLKAGDFTATRKMLIRK